MRLAATNISNSRRVHRGSFRAGRTPDRLAAVGPEVTGGNSQSCISGCADHCLIAGERMHVLRHLIHAQSMGDFTTCLALGEAADRHDLAPCLASWAARNCLPIASIGRAQQRKESLVLVDGQKLAVAQRPALRREIEAKDSDLGQERFSHGCDSLYFGVQPKLHQRR